MARTSSRAVRSGRSRPRGDVGRQVAEGLQGALEVPQEAGRVVRDAPVVGRAHDELVTPPRRAGEEFVDVGLPVGDVDDARALREARRALALRIDPAHALRLTQPQFVAPAAPPARRGVARPGALLQETQRFPVGRDREARVHVRPQHVGLTNGPHPPWRACS